MDTDLLEVIDRNSNEMVCSSAVLRSSRQKSGVQRWFEIKMLKMLSGFLEVGNFMSKEIVVVGEILPSLGFSVVVGPHHVGIQQTDGNGDFAEICVEERDIDALIYLLQQSQKELRNFVDEPKKTEE